MAQFIALAASVVSLALPGTGKRDGDAVRVPISNSHLARSLIPSSFSFGLVSGAGLAVFLIHQIEKYRIKERIRKYCRNIMTQNDKNSNDSTNNNNAEMHSYANTAKFEVLASSANTLSSHLHCAKVTLKPGTGLAQLRSEGAELYYILRGRGHFFQECGVEDDKCSGSDIVQNEFIIVEPWKLRSIKNKHTEDLVFLRITDIVQGEQSEVVTLQTENINAAEILIDVATGFKSSFSKFTQMVHGKRSETK